MNSKADWFFDKAEKWQKEFQKLRTIADKFPLEEELKWGKPCYSLNGANIFLIHGFKEYCALLFMKGVLMKDPKGILVQQTPTVQAARQIRFKSLKEIVAQEHDLKSYIAQAIEVEKSGLEVKYKKSSEFPVPAEFQSALKASPKLKAAFAALTPGRQRGYLLHFGSAKQSQTRAARVQKWTPNILKGKGLDD